MICFEKMQMVRHANIEVEMQVVGPDGLGVVDTSTNKFTTDPLSGKTICRYTLNGRRYRESFYNKELEPVVD